MRPGTNMHNSKPDATRHAAPIYLVSPYHALISNDKITRISEPDNMVYGIDSLACKIEVPRSIPGADGARFSPSFSPLSLSVWEFLPFLLKSQEGLGLLNTGFRK